MRQTSFSSTELALATYMYLSTSFLFNYLQIYIMYDLVKIAESVASGT